jgi:hypothetical protein
VRKVVWIDTREKANRRTCRPGDSLDAVKLAFFNDSLVWLSSTFDTVLIIIALGRQQLRDFVNLTTATAAERPRGEPHCLTDFEFVLVHVTPIRELHRFGA